MNQAFVKWGLEGKLLLIAAGEILVALLFLIPRTSSPGNFIVDGSFWWRYCHAYGTWRVVCHCCNYSFTCVGSNFFKKPGNVQFLKGGVKIVNLRYCCRRGK